MRLKKRYWIGIPLLLSGAGWYGYNQWNKAPESLAQKEAQHVMDAQSLLSKFQTDYAGSNHKFVNQIIEISGTCTNVESRFESTGDTVQFVYMGGKGSGDILCQLESPKGSLPRKGDPIQCKGVCTGYDDLTGGVLMNRCVLTNP